MMKKILALVLALMLSLTACGGRASTAGDTSESISPAGTAEPAPAQPDSSAAPGESAPSDLSGVAPKEILIAYFGVVEDRNGVDTVANASRVGTDAGIAGNCQFIAQAIQEAVGGELFAIETVQDYPRSHEALLDFAYDELRQNARPELSGEIENLDDYDVIFLGYPIWWGIAAWPVDTFVKANDFTGKTVIPFCTSSSSGLGQSGALLEEMANGGDWQEGRRFPSGASAGTVAAWVNGLNLPSAPAVEETAWSSQQEGRTLVVYFSQPETTDPNNMTTEEANSTVVINGQVLGNTQYMAQVIQRTTNADIYRIEPQNPYPTDHATLVAQAREEQDQDTRPAIKDSIANFGSYDTVFIGYPIWWSDLPQILYTFFDTYDFSGKTVIPFSTHGGSSFSGTPAAIQSLEPNAKLLEGLTISRNHIQDAEQEIVDWVKGLDI